MPYFATSQEWLAQSQLLFQAHPETTRITSKYTTKPYTPRPAPGTTTSTSTPAAVPRGEIVLKAFDPVSGVTLKYRTTKAAEVSRLMGASMAAMGKGMGGLEDGEGDVQMGDRSAAVPAATAKTTSAIEGVAQGRGGAPPATITGGAAGAGGKKKKKGKK